MKTQTGKTKDFADILRGSHTITKKEVMTSQNQSGNDSNKKTDKPVKHKKPFNSNVCFLCGMEGHYGSSTSCYAAKQVRKNYFN